MKGFRFYADYDSPRHRKADTVPGRSTLNETPAPAGNCLAIPLGDSGRPYGLAGDVVECLSATFGHGNSDVSTSAVSAQYLRLNCRRVSESEARRIHPALFARLESEA